MNSTNKSFELNFFKGKKIKFNERSVIYFFLISAVILFLASSFFKQFELSIVSFSAILLNGIGLFFFNKSSSFSNFIFYSLLFLNLIVSLFFEKNVGFYICYFGIALLNVILFPINKLKQIRVNFVLIFICILFFLFYEYKNLPKIKIEENFKIYIFRFIYYFIFFIVCFAVTIITFNLKELESKILFYNQIILEVFENQIHSFFQIDNQYNIERFNTKASELFYLLFQKEILAGKNLLDYFINFDERNSILKLLNHVLINGNKVVIEKEFFFEKLSVWFLIIIDKIQLDLNEPKLIICFKNITSLKETEHYEQNLKNRAEMINLKKNKFIKIVTTKMLKPLEKILEIKNSIDKNKFQPNDLNYIDLIEFSTNHLIFFMKDLKSNSEFLSDKIFLKNKKDNLKLRIKLLFESFRLTHKFKEIEFFLVIDEKIPDQLFFDSKLISQILYNLLSNAYKFTEKGKIELSLSLISLNPKAKILFEVIDTGIGIKKESSDLIFRNFSQADNEVYKKFGGTGLGLNIVKRILESYNSEIFLESELMKGSKFSFFLELDI